MIAEEVEEWFKKAKEGIEKANADADKKNYDYLTHDDDQVETGMSQELAKHINKRFLGINTEHENHVEKKGMAFQKAISKEKIQRNRKKRMLSLADDTVFNSENDQKRSQSVKYTSFKEQINSQSGPKMLDHQIQAKKIRELSFMKQLKDDGLDIVISK